MVESGIRELIHECDGVGPIARCRSHAHGDGSVPSHLATKLTLSR
jgi:hypothetical protein